ncbi:uncharacterized protein LOC116738669 [Nasonia vitripennis]|uniref:Uncharacterized protein n=1 Tax=Nasonia vitripennis TaxID=7425 RepID=A0A7M7R1A1_NASVI|nr:uncharacterized protein LOC116738669 [Nasonia vitripennis]
MNKKVMSDVFKFADTKKVGPHCLETGKKKYPCFYCDEKLTTLSRHYKSKHAEEAIVQEIKQYEPSRRLKGQKITDNQKYTDYLYSYLRKAAILKHNLQADFNDQFHIARTRRESDEDRTVSMYELCTTCSGFYAKSYYHKHVKKCTNNTKSTLQARIEGNAAIGKKSASIKEHLQKVLLNLRKGAIKDIIEEDDVIITFGNGLSYKHRHHYHQGDMIRARLRCTARFLTILRNISNNTVKSYADFFKPEHLDYLFPAINEIGQYNQVTDLYDVPATAAAAGAYVNELCDTYIGMCIKAKDQSACDDAMKFMHLYKTDYNKYVTKSVAESTVEMQRNNKVELPTEEDLRLFYTSITSRRDELIDDLKNNGFNMTKWIELGEVTTIHLVMFSSRRVGETERLKKGNFAKIERLESNNNGSRKLSYEEIEFLQSFRRILIRGKLNRTVPLLMIDKDEEAINLYMSFFKVEEANVDKNNPYVFALPHFSHKLDQEFERNII